MASFTIEKRNKANGETRYRCKVRLKKSGAIIHTESQTFSKKELAANWGKLRCEALDNGTLSFPQTVSLGTLLTLYYENNELWENTGRTKRYVIMMLIDCDISRINSNELKTSDLIEHCRNRKNAGTSPATIYHDIAYLRSVMKKAKPVWNITANHQVFEEAVPILIEMRLVGKSQKRTRRPTSLEIEELKSGLQQRIENRPNGQPQIPYIDILDFSILSCMRIGEVCSLRWEDLNENHKTILVRDRKDPRKKTGNHLLVPLLGGAYEIVMRQSKADELIFPYNSRSVTAGFQRVRNQLGIKDLRYHDLRREGASQLFEKGYTLEEVAQVTGHRDLNILWQVYTQLFPHKLHEKEQS